MAERKRTFGLDTAMGLLETLLVRTASLALLVLTGLTTADALGRYLLNSPIPGTGEIIEDYFMIALIFLPLSYSFMQEGHVHVTMIERYFPGGVKRAVGKMNLLLSFALFGLIVLAGWDASSRPGGSRRSRQVPWATPCGPVLLVPIGCGLLCLRIAQVFFGGAKRGQAVTHDEDRVA
jgi:TRAP-type C4-dicarboxylate transport system permease small subunit